MSAVGLSSRAIIGEFYLALEQARGQGWIDAVSALFQSDQESETYKWLGMSPVMREWVGGRNPKGFRENGITITNLHYEATIEVMVREMRRDKTGQVMRRIQELAQRTEAHWASLLTTLIINGESTACYDGQFYFDTDHSEGSSGTQSNDISVDVSALPVTVATGTPTDPSAGQMVHAILEGVEQIYSFLDDQGEPMNELASSFLVMVPVPLYHVGLHAATSAMIDNGESNIIPGAGLDVRIVPNARLTWTDSFAVFRTDGSAAPLIRQEEAPVDLKVQAEGSAEEFENDRHLYGVDAWRNVGYGFWQHACLVTMT